MRPNTRGDLAITGPDRVRAAFAEVAEALLALHAEASEDRAGSRTAPEPDSLLTVFDVAARLRQSAWSVRQEARRWPFTRRVGRNGKQLRFVRSEFEAWLRAERL